MPTSRHRSSSNAPSDRRRADLRRKRALAEAQARAERRDVWRRRRKRLLAGAGIGVAVLGAVIGIVVLAGGDDGGGSETAGGAGKTPELRAPVVPGAEGRLEIKTIPTSYQVSYRTETFPDGEKEGVTPSVSTESVVVERPLNGRLVNLSGEPPGETVQLDIRSVLGKRGDYTARDQPKVTAQEPGLPLGDMRIDAVLDELVERNLMRPKERRRVLKRECQVYRTGSPVESLSITAPSDLIYVDACIDDSGLMLEEMVVNDGKVFTRVTAVDVDVLVKPPPDTFAVAGSPAGAEGGLTLSPLPLDAPPAPGYWQFAPTPTGYTHVARYMQTQPGGQGGASQTYVDVYTGGVEVIIVQQGPKAAEPEPGILPGTELPVGALGTASIVPGLAGNVLTAHPTPDTFVRVTATHPFDRLATFAGLLRSG